MRNLPNSLQSALASGVTTLCWCWRITRADGVALGLTEHDQDLTVDGTVFHGGSAGMTGDVHAQLGMARESAGLDAQLTSSLITETDVAAGAYDDARVDVIRVNWMDPSSFVVVWRGRMGDMRRTDVGFAVDVSGLKADLERTVGRVIQRRCTAEVGDSQCGVDLATTSFQATGVVTSTRSVRSFGASGLSSFDDAWFVGGLLVWDSGPNAGNSARVESQVTGGAETSLSLWAPPAVAIGVGDAFTVTAGCDKRWRTCRTKFNNVLNFRGFPMIPGDDWLMAGPLEGENHDGASLWTDRDD